MNNTNVSWRELLWDGIDDNTGEFVRGQLIRRRELDGTQGYWICVNPYLITFENGFSSAIGGWRKVVPSSLKRTEFVEVEETDG